MIGAIDIKEKLSLFNTHWDPKVVGEINRQEVKIDKLIGEFVWHDHKDADELFLVVKGYFIMHFRDKDVRVNEGEIVIVPMGVEHKPEAPEECHIVLIDPKGTVNTGDVESDKTVKAVEQI